ncbi:hypothetical protein QTL95_18275 [Rhizobium sp. S152]|uniref:hypothetical protein n=1 Tax=Rhizobium sp. S152 TaxID=3055038 RepID=UPI0025A95BDD|nr:hypothetical protein [Rhizobium sp. S152]MDM9627841.1 hypothetical protein [Rhizobium sp. S152]
MYVRKRLMEIKERLGPVTRELGLRHSLRKTADDELVLCFDRRDENGVRWVSPTCFIFPSAKWTREDEISWKHVMLDLDETVSYPIGTNGWVFYERDFNMLCGHPVAPAETDAEVDRAFELAAENLRGQALAPRAFGLDLPYVIGDIDIGQLWEFLEPECRRRNIEQVAVIRREDRKEAYVFEFEGRSFEIEYREGRAVLLEDGQAIRFLGEEEDHMEAARELGAALAEIEARALLNTGR